MRTVPMTDMIDHVIIKDQRITAKSIHVWVGVSGVAFEQQEGYDKCEGYDKKWPDDFARVGEPGIIRWLFFDRLIGGVSLFSIALKRPKCMTCCPELHSKHHQPNR